MRRRPRARRLAAALALCAGALVAHAPESAAPLSAGGMADAAREAKRATALLVAGDESGAEAAYRRTLELDPRSTTARVGLGRLLLEHGRRWAARRELARALELDPSHAEATYLLAVVYDELGFERSARRRYRRAFELAPELADPTTHPEVARNRQALAALLRLWPREDDSFGASVTADAPSAGDTHAAAESTGDRRGGGYARLVAGERSGDRGEELETESGRQEAANAPAAGGPGASERRAPARTDRVIGPSDLRTGTTVNQSVAPGASTGSGARRPARGGVRKLAPRFTPPPAPFVPDEDSTGRIEPRIEPTDPNAFAVAGRGTAGRGAYSAPAPPVRGTSANPSTTSVGEP